MLSSRFLRPHLSTHLALLAAALAGGGCSEETAPPPILGPDPVTVIQLTTDPSDERAAAWSPDGTRIAFASDRIWRELQPVRARPRLAKGGAADHGEL